MNTAILKTKLEEEKIRLEKELGGIAIESKGVPGDWEALPPETDDIDTRDEVAERLEDLTERKAEEITLEAQLAKVTGALERLENGTYGLCRVCDQEIEADRLEASPSATTCKLHLEN